MIIGSNFDSDLTNVFEFEKVYTWRWITKLCILHAGFLQAIFIMVASEQREKILNIQKT